MSSCNVEVERRRLEIDEAEVLRHFRRHVPEYIWSRLQESKILGVLTGAFPVSQGEVSWSMVVAVCEQLEVDPELLAHLARGPVTPTPPVAPPM